MRYFLHFAYNGKDYHGWQRQPGALTVQERVEEALTKLLHVPTAAIGAGRTDTGVNASMMVAHFDSATSIDDPNRFIASMNGIADPFNITFYSVSSVQDTAHARFDATARTYRYHIHIRRNPFLFPYSLQVRDNIDFELMNRAAEVLIDTSDFTSFAKLHGQTKTNICQVSSAQWKQMKDDSTRWYFEITANRFLRNMVRSITGTLLDIGMKKLSIKDFKRIIDARNRNEAGTSMPPSPLFLYNITYPYWKP